VILEVGNREAGVVRIQGNHGVIRLQSDGHRGGGVVEIKAGEGISPGEAVGGQAG